MWWNRKKKTKAPKASTSPEQIAVQPFDREKPEAIIKCYSCKESLWEMQVRHHKGRVVSTRNMPTGKNSCSLKDGDWTCPLCGKDFAPLKDEERKIMVESVKTGQIVYL